MDEGAELREGDDVVAAAGELPFAHAQQQAVGADVGESVHGEIEAGAQFQKSRHPAGGLHRAGIRQQYAVEDLEQGGFPRAVAADDAEGFAILHPEAETPQGLVAGVEWPAQHNLLETIGGPMVELEGFFETRDLDHCPPPCVPTREGVWPGDLALGSKKITDILLQLAA